MNKDDFDRTAESDTLERVAGKLATGMVIASGILGLAIYWRPAPPRFQAVAAPNGEILRIDTRKGSIISCAADNKCYLVLKSGQHLTSGGERKAIAAPAAPQPALPQPAVAPPKP